MKQHREAVADPQVGETYPFEYHCYEGEDSSDAELWHHTGQTCEVLYELGPDECDIEEVGRMFHVRFADGFEYDVFHDEIVK